jgi:hypothetical protein
MGKKIIMDELSMWFLDKANTDKLLDYLVKKEILKTAQEVTEYLSCKDYSVYNALWNMYNREVNPMVQRPIGVEEFFDNRWYPINGEWYKSVTTVTKIYPNPGLVQAIGRLGNEEMELRMEEGGERGSKVHDALQNNAIVKREFYDDEEWLMIVNANLLNAQYKPQLLMNEHVVYSTKHRYAGRLDRIVKIDEDLWGFGRPTIHLIDFKTGKVIGTEAWLQLAALKQATEERYNLIIDLWGINDLRRGKYRCIADRTDVKDRSKNILNKIEGITATHQAITEAYTEDFDIFLALCKVWDYDHAGQKPKRFPVFPVPAEIDLSIPVIGEAPEEKAATTPEIEFITNVQVDGKGGVIFPNKIPVQGEVNAQEKPKVITLDEPIKLDYPGSSLPEPPPKQSSEEPHNPEVPPETPPNRYRRTKK